MDLTRYPNATDIEVLLKSAAFWPAGTDESAKVLYAREEATIGAAAAAAEFETRTGYYPFLSTSAEEEERLFLADPKLLYGCGRVALNSGLLSCSSITVHGNALPSTGHWYLYPSDAPGRRRPYTSVYFPLYKYWAAHYRFRPIEIKVTGRWGYCTQVPGDVWAELLQYGAVKTLSQVENAQSIASISQDGFSKSWDIVGIITQKDLLNEWGRRFDAACGRYMLTTF